MATGFGNKAECPKCNAMLWSGKYCSNCNQQYDD